MIPTAHTPRFLGQRAKELLRLGLATANMSINALATRLHMDSDATAEKWADLRSDKHVPMWILASAELPASVRATIIAGLDALYTAHVRGAPLDVEAESNVITGIMGNVLAAIAGAMRDRHWSTDEAREALPFATQLLAHVEAFVRMLTERAGVDRQTRLEAVK